MRISVAVPARFGTHLVMGAFRVVPTDMRAEHYSGPGIGTGDAMQPSARPTAPLLEREAALACLHEYAEDARGGSGRLVMIAGEAGVGKTTLVEHFEQQLHGAAWYWSACDGLFTPRPLGPLFDLAGQLGGEIGQLCRQGVGREDLFRTLHQQTSTTSVLNVVVIEDIHWADEATLDLIRYLGRRLRGASLLIVTTYRDDSIASDHPLRVVLGDLAPLAASRRIGLAPLTPHAVTKMAEDSNIAASELYKLTGGNPFYVAEVLRDGMADEVPASARDVVLARVARLHRDTRAVLDIAASTSGRIDVGLLQTASTSRPSAIEELIASGLLLDGGDGLRFRHEIARLAVAQTIPADRRRFIHRSLLAQLQSMGCQDDARLAFHAEEAGDASAVLRYAPAAAHRAARMASHREAAAQFERALRYAPGDFETLPDLYEGFADEVSLLDRWEQAEQAAERALELWQNRGSRLRAGDAWRRLSRIRSSMCRGQDAIEAAEAAVATLTPLGPTVELARAYAVCANQRMLYAQNDAAIGLSRIAAQLSEPLGATDILSDAWITSATSSAPMGLEWTDRLLEALALALAHGHHNQAARAYANLAALHIDSRRFDAGAMYLEEGSTYCAEHDLTTFLVCLACERAVMLDRMGKWDQSLAMATKHLMGAGPSPTNRLSLLVRQGAIWARRGTADPWESLDEATATAEQTAEPQQLVAVRLARAEAKWLVEDQQGARLEAELADDVCATLGEWQRGEVAVWLSRTGSPRPPRGNVAEPYRLQLAGDTVGSSRIWQELSCPYEAALAMASAADEAQLRDATTILTHLGATPAARLVQKRMRALGMRSVAVGPRASTRAHPLGLTLREREVLGLIRAQQTNAEIAAKLVISTRTVHHHVSAILAKLGVSTRAQAAHQAEELLADRD
ncbi:AAA family ATPase [Kribbella sp. NPDC049584]|uniref:ATP-binding protein n=1 Tax=Kribbella sp. NPDC049584 TaxID=3154833 RepID=UPI0034342CB2